MRVGGGTDSHGLVAFTQEVTPKVMGDVAFALDAGGSIRHSVAYNIQQNDGGEHHRKDRPEGGMYVKETDTALTVGTTDKTVVLGVSENQRAELRLTPYSRQLTSGGGKPGQGYPAALTQYGVRRLIPVECERLQGFPDKWTAGQSDSKRYKQLGNAVCVPVGEWIGRRIMLNIPGEAT